MSDLQELEKELKTYPKAEKAVMRMWTPALSNEDIDALAQIVS